MTYLQRLALVLDGIDSPSAHEAALRIAAEMQGQLDAQDTIITLQRQAMETLMQAVELAKDRAALWERHCEEVMARCNLLAEHAANLERRVEMQTLCLRAVRRSLREGVRDEDQCGRASRLVGVEGIAGLLGRME